MSAKLKKYRYDKDMINFIPMIILLLGAMILIGLGERHHQKKQRINKNKQNILKWNRKDQVG